MDADHFLAPEIVTWLDQAIDVYYRGRIYGLLDQVEHNVSGDLALQWHELMEEMFGDSESLKRGLIDEAMNDDRVSGVAIKWLQKLL